MVDPLDDLVLGEAAHRPMSKDHIDAVDRLYWSPEERAMGVLNLLENHLKQLKDTKELKDLPSNWDKLCFCIEYMAQQAIALQSDEFLEIAKSASKWLYAAHYSAPSAIYGAPDKKRIVDKEKQNASKKIESQTTEEIPVSRRSGIQDSGERSIPHGLEGFI